MKTAAAWILLIASVLAGCSAPEGAPDLENDPADPLPTADPRDPERRPRGEPDPENGTQEPEDGNTTQDGNATGQGEPLFQTGILADVFGPSPAVVNLSFEVVSEYAADHQQIWFTYTIDLNGDNLTDLSGESPDFFQRDENGTIIRHPNGAPVVTPLVVNRTYEFPGLYNVTLHVERYRASEFEQKTEVLPLVIEAGPSFAEMCPTEEASAGIGGTYIASDNTRWRETNQVGGLQRGDKHPDCPRPDERIG